MLVTVTEKIRPLLLQPLQNQWVDRPLHKASSESQFQRRGNGSYSYEGKAVPMLTSLFVRCNLMCSSIEIEIRCINVKETPFEIIIVVRILKYWTCRNVCVCFVNIKSRKK